MIAVKAVLSEPFQATVEIPNDGGRCCGARSMGVRARREQVPLTIVTASTLYTLQGTTAMPRLIYHWRTPRRLSRNMKWVAAYMALSRVRSLREFRSIGISTAIRKLIDEGPPEGMLTRFLDLFREKALETEEAVQAAFKELGWNA